MRLAERVTLALGRDLTLGNLLERLARVHGRRRLVVEDSGFEVTAAEAADLVDRWAGAVAERSEPGDRVVLATSNGYEQFLLTLAVSRAGRIPAPVNAHMTAAEIDHVVADSGAALVVRSVDDLAGGVALGRAVPVAASDVAALFYTSGTTGKPKGAQLTHRGLLGGVSMAALLPSGLRRDELVLALPVAHIYGFSLLVTTACAGVPVYYLRHFNPVRVLDAIEGRRASAFAGVPAMYRMLEEAGAAERDLTSVRLWISGADAMPADLAARFKRFGATATLPVFGRAVGEVTFAEGYGMVETGGGVAIRVSPPLLPPGLGGSVGVPLPGNRLRVVGTDGDEVGIGGVGELELTGPGVLKGYHGAPEATAQALTDDGWLRTGDLVRKGPLGMFSFEGRQKDVIKRAGYSVYTVEVEQALKENPEVLEAIVVPVADERDGELPVAVVRLRPGVTVADLGLGAWAAERLSRYKVPVEFHAFDDFPRTGTSKVQRRELVTAVEALRAQGAKPAPARKAAAGKPGKPRNTVAKTAKTTGTKRSSPARPR